MDSENSSFQESVTKLVPKKDDAESGNKNVSTETVNLKGKSSDIEAKEKYLPDYRLADLVHRLRFAEERNESCYESIKQELLARVVEDEMLPFYQHLCTTFGWEEDADLTQKLQAANDAELKNLEDQIEDATGNYGDSEVREALLNKANFFCRIVDKEKAIAQYGVAFEKTLGAGGRLDIILTLIRLGLFHQDVDSVKMNIAKAKEELEKGGDWERRNKLRVYEALYLILMRDFKQASALLLDAVSTFTATELMSFETFIFYVSMASMLTLDRPTLKKSIITAPEVLQVVAQDECFQKFINSFYNCKYKVFMENLIPIADRIYRDRFFGKHYRFFIRSIRLRAYSQFLEPFKSVTMNGMANAFGVSEDFVDREISSFIASGKLHCKIDKINKRIDSNSPDARDSLYQKIIKEGDMLLNKTQKLSRIIDV